MSRHWWTWAAHAALLLAILAVHIGWLLNTHDPMIGSRFGAALIGIGIIVTAQPYFRTGFQEAVNRQMPGHHLSVYASAAHIQHQAAEHKLALPGVMHDVVAERVVGVALILFGTLASGYGDLPLRWLGFAAD